MLNTCDDDGKYSLAVSPLPELTRHVGSHSDQPAGRGDTPAFKLASQGWRVYSI